MSARRTIALTAALAALTASACTSTDDPTTATTTPSTSTSSTSTTFPTATTTPAARETADPATAAPAPAATSATTATEPAADAVVDGVVIRFTAGATTIDVTVTDDSATIRDLLSMLPLTLRFEDLNGREKISYLPRPLDTTDAPGADPEDGDLIYYAPWGNLGFYYNAAGIGFDDDVVHLGTYSATPEQLTELEGNDVSVDVID